MALTFHKDTIQKPIPVTNRKVRPAAAIQREIAETNVKLKGLQAELDATKAKPAKAEKAE